MAKDLPNNIVSAEQKLTMSSKNYNNIEIEDIYINYKLNGKHHRTDGPAFICYMTNKIICNEQYYINGSLLPKDEFDKLCKTITK